MITKTARRVQLLMIKKMSCFLLIIVLLVFTLPFGVLAEEQDASFTGKPPAVTVVTSGEENAFIYGGRVWSARNVGSYPNNTPEWVDTVEEKVDWVAEQCRASGAVDPWDIALWLHNWLIYNANYDYTYSQYSADGVLLKGTGVCNSYALAYGLLLDKFGIENIKLDAPAMNHAWNIVKLNGQWCHVDCTWDDPNEGGYENFAYFGLNDELMSRDHFWDTSDYPACTSKQNYYPIASGLNVAASREEMMALLNQLAEVRTQQFDIYYIGSDPDFSLSDTLKEWSDLNSWTYSIMGWGCFGTNYMITVTVTYGPSWEDPGADHVHSYTGIITDPSCVESGYTTYLCSCGDMFIADEVPALGHQWMEANCSAPKTCALCKITTGAIGSSHVYDSQLDGTCNFCSVHRETVEIRQVTHMLRMYNPYTGEHFYTGSEVEKDNLVAAGWKYEGVGFTFPANTGAPVYRLYDPATGEHLYTMDEEEKATLEAAGWNYEGIAFNSAYDTEAVQHRLHNPYATVGAYHFTFSEEEKQNLINAGWEYQGIGWFSCWK